MFGFKKRAPEFTHNAIQYVNTEKFSLADLKGNIVLIDFWTYCCINCIRTVPDLSFLEEKFIDEPVQILGVHSAKFDNENNAANVLNAIGRYEIKHPVILDEKMEVWDSFAIHAWPTLILIDSEGYVRKGYSGEGHRQELIQDISELLEEGKKKRTLAGKFNPVFTKQPEPPVLYYPAKISIQDDTIAIANSNRNTILLGTISDDSIKIEKSIGTGEKGARDGSFDQATFSKPQGVTMSGDKLYVADTDNGAIRLIDLERGIVSTLSTQTLSSPWDLAIYGNNLYIALAGTHQIGKIDLGNDSFSIFAGNRYENIVDGFAMQASLAQPSGLSINKDTLYFADSETSSIRFIRLQDPYIVQTIVGHGLFTFGQQDGNTSEALFQHPLGLCAKENLIYVADTYNSAIRMIDLEKNVVSTLISSMGHDVCRIDDKECNVLALNEPSDVKVWKDNLIISDTNNHLMRRFNLRTNELTELNIES